MLSIGLVGLERLMHIYAWQMALYELGATLKFLCVVAVKENINLRD